ncbi:hypothetical protein VPH35_013323 [Triticum aestivum]
MAAQELRSPAKRAADWIPRALPSNKASASARARRLLSGGRFFQRVVPGDDDVTGVGIPKVHRRGIMRDHQGLHAAVVSLQGSGVCWGRSSSMEMDVQSAGRRRHYPPGGRL